MPSRAPTPSSAAPDPAALVAAPFEQVLDALAREPGEALHDLFASRLVELLRDGSLEELRAAANALEPWLADQKDHRALLTGAADLVWHAALQVGPDAAKAVLASHDKYGPKLLRALAEGKRPRQDLIGELEGIAEATLTRMLNQFEQVALVRREREGRRVVVRLGPAGAELLDRSRPARWDKRTTNDEKIAKVRSGRVAAKARLSRVRSALHRAAVATPAPPPG